MASALSLLHWIASPSLETCRSLLNFLLSTHGDGLKPSTHVGIHSRPWIARIAVTGNSATDVFVTQKSQLIRELGVWICPRLIGRPATIPPLQTSEAYLAL